MFKKIIVAVAFVITCFGAVGQSLNSNSTLIYFKGNSDILHKNYMDNSQSLRWLDNQMKTKRDEVLMGRAYFEIVGFISPQEVDNPIAINHISTLASVVRAYLKANYYIDHFYVTFSIDATRYVHNTVELNIIQGRPANDNRKLIHYTLKPLQRDYLDGYIYGIPYVEVKSKSTAPNPTNKVSQSGNYNLYTWSREKGYTKASDRDIFGNSEKLYYKDKDGRYRVASTKDIANIVNNKSISTKETNRNTTVIKYQRIAK